MAFATPEDMERRSQGAITTASHPYLADELAAATRNIQDFCRWHVAPAKTCTYRRVTPLYESVWLPAMEIDRIDSVTIDGTEYDEQRLGNIKFDPATGWTNLAGSDVTIEYTAGFDPVPENLKSLTLELAALSLGTSLGQTREQAGTVSVTYGRSGGGLDAAAEQRLAAYRIGRLP